MPLAFFCTLFFRHRKKSVSAPWDGQSQSAPESARQAPPGAGDCACGRTGGFPLAPSPLRIASQSNRTPHRAASPLPAPESARQAPPRGISYGKVVTYRCKQGGFPLAPLHPLRIASQNNRALHRAASPFPAPESARQAPWGTCLQQSCCLMLQAGWLAARPPAPPSDRHPKQSSAP